MQAAQEAGLPLYPLARRAHGRRTAESHPSPQLRSDLGSRALFRFISSRENAGSAWRYGDDVRVGLRQPGGERGELIGERPRLLFVAVDITQVSLV